MTLVVSIILFVLIIGLLIFLHEFGHYFAAKRNGIGVTEFAIGMGPKLFSWRRNETQFSVRLIPIGGYCLFLGDDSGLVPEDEDEALDEMDPEERRKQEEFRATHAYHAKNVWQRISVVLAGPFVNMLVAFLFACLLIGLVGAALPLLAIYYLYVNVIIVAGQKFSALSDILKFMPVEELFRQLLPVALVLGVGIGFLGSVFTVRKHLKV